MPLQITFSADDRQEYCEALNLQPGVPYSAREVDQHLLYILATGNPDQCERAKRAYVNVRQEAESWMKNVEDGIYRPLLAEHGPNFTCTVDSENGVSGFEVAGSLYEASPKSSKRPLNKLTLLCAILSAVIFFGGIVPTLLKISHSPHPIQQRK